MGFSPADILNMVALSFGMAGSFMMFYFSPKVSSRTILYQRSEMDHILKRDAHKNKMIRRGMFLLFIGFILQAAAIFLNVRIKIV